jgi:four helix bundle protein
MGDYKKLKVWQAADDLAVQIYAHTKGFPNHELYGLRSQLRRAAVSVPSNIAEGAGRNGDKEFSRFVNIALGSANEVAYQIHLSGRLGYMTPEVVNDLGARSEAIKRMLAALCRKTGE